MNSLLSSYTSCDSSVSTCSLSSTSGGDLSITPDSSTISASVADTDLVEISGSCIDLNRKNNRIIVQVFENEDESRIPIIDNTVDVGCQENISTTELQPTISGTAEVKKTCLVVNRGIGVTDGSSSVSQYPQCFNGRFGFYVRVGRITRQSLTSSDVSETTNPRKNYLVRMKLRTNEGGTTDSAWNYVSINRYVPTPGFSVTANNSDHRCEINLDPYKYKDIRYNAFYSWTGPVSGTYSNSVSGTLYTSFQPVFPGASDGTTVEKYYHDGFGADSVGTISGIPASATLSAGLMPGVTYKYKLEAVDYSYAYDHLASNTIPRESSGYSSEVTCKMKAAYVSGNSTTTNSSSKRTKCVLTLVGANVRTGSPYKIEWRYQTSGYDWTISAPSTGILLTNGSGITCDSTKCEVNRTNHLSIASDADFWISARSYIDTDGDGLFTDGEAFGAWADLDSSTPDLYKCRFDSD